jgi:hypothetical protein
VMGIWTLPLPQYGEVETDLDTEYKRLNQKDIKNT